MINHRRESAIIAQYFRMKAVRILISVIVPVRELVLATATGIFWILDAIWLCSVGVADAG